MLTAPSLARCLRTALAENRGRVVLNLRDVTFVDGKGLRTIERFARDCRAHGVSFALTRVAPRIRDLIELVGLDRLLLILDSGQGKHEGARSVHEVSDARRVE